MNDEAFVAAVEACTLPAAQFTHAAHLRLGYLYLQAAGFARALERTSDSIRRYATSLGAAGKYHETITVAYLALIHERMMARGDAGGWQAFAAENPDLFEPGLLQRIYPAGQLETELARRAFVLPRAAAR